MKSILCIVHVFYPEFWPELASCLRNIGEPFDLVVTYVDDSKGIPEMVLADFPSARLILCENKGFDIWPFLKALQSVKFEDYSIMVKLHTKRDVKRGGRPLVFNHCNFAESAWREYLLGFIRDRESWLATKARLSMDGVGMVADRHVIMNRSDTPWFKTRRSMDAAVEFVERLYGAPVAGVRFVAGTMFAARPRVFSKLVSRGWTADDFSESVRDGTEQTAHLLERVLGAIVSAEGLHIDSPRGDLTRWRFCASARDNLAAFMRFLWSDERVGGRRIVKVFGISLYRSGGKAAIPAREDCVVIDPPENPLDYADVLRAYVLREAARRAGDTARVIGAAPCHVPLFSGNIVRAVRTRRFLRKYVKPAVGLPPEGARRADAGPHPHGGLRFMPSGTRVFARHWKEVSFLPFSSLHETQPSRRKGFCARTRSGLAILRRRPWLGRPGAVFRRRRKLHMGYDGHKPWQIVRRRVRQAGRGRHSEGGAQ